MTDAHRGMRLTGQIFCRFVPNCGSVSAVVQFTANLSTLSGISKELVVVMY